MKLYDDFWYWSFIVIFLILGFYIGTQTTGSFTWGEPEWYEYPVSNSTSVQFSSSVMEELNAQYENASVTETEYVACLDPFIVEGVYNVKYVEQVTYPKINFVNKTTVHHDFCATSMEIHSHPKGYSMYPSDADIYSDIEGRISVSCIQYSIDHVFCYSVQYRKITARIKQ